MKIVRLPFTKGAMIKKLKQSRARSKFQKGVIEQAIELIDQLDEGKQPTLKNLLNGADDWDIYSFCGNALAYNADIADRYLTKSEAYNKKGYFKDKRDYLYYLKLQARALRLAYEKIDNIYLSNFHDNNPKNFRGNPKIFENIYLDTRD